MSLTTDEAARLASLQAAYDKKISGTAVKSVMSGGRRMDNADAETDKLKAEIEALQAKASAPCGRRRGAVRFHVR